MFEMFDWGNSIFVFEILVAECIFVYSFPKRKHFWPVFLIGFPVLTLISYFFPIPDSLFQNQFYQFFRLMTLFLITVGFMALCLKVKPIVLISSCVSGYALQHLSYNVVNLLALTPFLESVGSGFFTRDRILELIVFPTVYLIVFFTFGREAAKNEFYKNYSKVFIFSSIFILFVCLIVSRFARLDASSDTAVLTDSLYAIACSILSLVLNYTLHFYSIERNKKETLERIDLEREKQFEISKKNNELLHVQVHDMKHMLSLIDSGDKAQLDQLNKTIETYENQFDTGNEALDVVLNEKAETCTEKGISLTFFGDGNLLSFVGKLDIYILFGNILDNAMEAVEKLEDANKKVISVTVSKHGDYVSIDSINYFEGELEFAEGIPQTTKTKDVSSHGYGTRSIKLIAEKYNGSAEFTSEDKVFDCSVFLLQKAEEEAKQSD